MSKHTPGPWEVRYARKTTDLPYEIFALHTLEFRLRPLACVDSNGPNGEHYAANAELIAAAPDMLEILKDISDWFDCYHSKNSGFWNTRHGQDVLVSLNKAEKIIRKCGAK